MVGQSKFAWMDNINSYQGFISDGSIPDSAGRHKLIFYQYFSCIFRKVKKILTLFGEKITLRGTRFHRAQMHQKLINTIPFGPGHTLPSETSPTINVAATAQCWKRKCKESLSTNPSCTWNGQRVVRRNVWEYLFVWASGSLGGNILDSVNPGTHP